MAAQGAINQQKTLSKVSIARPITTLRLKANAKTLASLDAAKKDVMAATKTERLEGIVDDAMELNQFLVEQIEYGPDPKAPSV